MKILVEISARHVHLSKEALDVLFGYGYDLSPRRSLSQPGQFLCEEKLKVVGPRDFIDKVSVLGPIRKESQVELSLTDARKIGINTVINESGNLVGSAGCILIGPKGEYKLKEGVIIAKRHIHMTPKDAIDAGVQDRQIVSIRINGDERALTFGDVLVRVSEKSSLACHIDTDEANAAGIRGKTYGELII